MKGLKSTPAMRRFIAATVIVSLMLVAFAPALLAQYEEHPAVGSWVFDIEPDNPDNPPNLATFHADGTLRDWNVNPTGVGAWEPTGERGVASTALYPVVGPDGSFIAFIPGRFMGEVSEDGQTLSGTYTLEFPAQPEGVFPPPGEYGPAEMVATRIVVEPLGETVGPWPPPPPPEE